MGLTAGKMPFFQMTIVTLFLLMNFPLGEGFNVIMSSQNTASMTPGELLVQILTEPESLIRLFDGFNLSFQMLRHLGRTGPALLRLPFDKSFLSNSYDHVGLESWRKHYYSRFQHEENGGNPVKQEIAISM
ncbi:hypothetical protein HNY73_010219 [Argiope bruennichi]|uniref:Uncharacterized protein n=1 Tax=Argiope bruennichi TaxID=94029 RepID=A0A8T0F0E2_ARGBR|nr:hypothetical protein HNY73_010219 [Argiope bruennichi]